MNAHPRWPPPILTKLKRDYNADLPQQTCSVNDLKSYVTRIHLEAGYHVVVLHAPERNPISLDDALEQSGWDESFVANLGGYVIRRTAWDAQCRSGGRYATV